MRDAWRSRAWSWTFVPRQVLTGGTSISWRRHGSAASTGPSFFGGAGEGSRVVVVSGTLLGPEGSGSLFGASLLGRVTGLGLHRLVEPFRLCVSPGVCGGWWGWGRRRCAVGDRPYVENYTVDASIFVCSQVFKGKRWMPWHQEPMKDVGICDKPRGVDNQTVIRGFPNGETRLEASPVTLA